MSCADYLEQFKEKLSIMEEYGGLVGEHPGIVKDELVVGVAAGTPSEAQKKKAEQTVREKVLVMTFLTGADSACYRELMNELEVDFLKVDEDYPTILITAYHLLEHYHAPKQEKPLGPPDMDGISFTNVGAEKGSHDKSKITCFRCGQAIFHTKRTNAKNRRDPTTTITTTTQTKMTQTTMTMQRRSQHPLRGLSC